MLRDNLTLPSIFLYTQQLNTLQRRVSSSIIIILCRIIFTKLLPTLQGKFDPCLVWRSTRHPSIDAWYLQMAPARVLRHLWSGGRGVWLHIPGVASHPAQCGPHRCWHQLTWSELQMLVQVAWWCPGLTTSVSSTAQRYSPLLSGARWVTACCSQTCVQ